MAAMGTLPWQSFKVSISMFILLIVLVIGVAIAVGAVSILGNQSTRSQPSTRATQKTALPEDKAKNPKTYLYKLNPALFTPTEVAFYQALRDAVEDHYLIFGKVRVADILSPRQTSTRSDWQGAFNKINAKHFDFVLCARESLNIVAAIELDDRSHDQPKRMQRDDFLNQAAQSAGLQLIRFSARSTYSAESLRRKLSKALAADQAESQLS